jgi:hypothetical protein
MKNILLFFAITFGIPFIAYSTPCSPPTNVINTDISLYSASYTWIPGGTETEWEVGIKLIGATVWNTTMVTAPNHTFYGIMFCSDYEVRIRAKCGTGIYSDYAPIDTFTTISPIPINLGINPDFLTDSSAIVSWMHGGTESAWILEYKLVTSSNWISSDIINTINYHITGLEADTTYEVRVKAICGAYESEFTTPVEFTTPIGTQYQIAALVYGPGTVTPSGIVYVNEGENQVFTFTPDSNSLLYQVIVDNIEVPFLNNQYEFLNVSAHHVIEFVFAVGTLENDILEKITLSPNPTSGTFEICFDETQLQVKECRVYDMYGKLMSIAPVNTNNTIIDVTDLSAGIYFVHMNSKIGVITKKFVKK